MKRYLLAATILAAAGSTPALAQSCVTDASGNTLCDPTSFHITDSKATGTGPVFLNEGVTFNVDEINNDVIDSPLTVFFAVPVGDAAPKVTFDDYNGSPLMVFSGTVNSLGSWTPTNGNGGDLYSFVGCGKCDASINEGNVDAVDGIGTKFNVYSISIDQGFTAMGIETIDGLFAKGTIIAPLSENIVTGAHGKTTTTFYDTSWTNTGFVNTTVAGVPEPATWLMALTGFGLLAGLGAMKRKARYAI
jgi:hypothetical protein